MKKYEIMYIVKAGLDDEARKAEIEKVHATILGAGAQITNVNEWGLKDFAYPIKDELRGYYVVIKVTAEPGSLKEFERLTKLNSNVLRYLVVVDESN